MRLAPWAAVAVPIAVGLLLGMLVGDLSKCAVTKLSEQSKSFQRDTQTELRNHELRLKSLEKK